MNPMIDPRLRRPEGRQGLSCKAQPLLPEGALVMELNFWEPGCYAQATVPRMQGLARQRPMNSNVAVELA